MSASNVIVQQRLQRWFDDGDRAALDQACALAQQHALDVGALMQWLEQEALAEDAARDIAIRRMRRALGLPMMPGPVCRPQPR